MRKVPRGFSGRGEGKIKGMTKILKYEGCNFFRQRLVLATLSSRPVQISEIRSDADEPGLREFEAGFIRLLDKLTNGSTIQVNETGIPHCLLSQQIVWCRVICLTMWCRYYPVLQTGSAGGWDAGT
jgi:hypothetical protein